MGLNGIEFLKIILHGLYLCFNGSIPLINSIIELFNHYSVNKSSVDGSWQAHGQQ